MGKRYAAEQHQAHVVAEEKRVVDQTREIGYARPI